MNYKLSFIVLFVLFLAACREEIPPIGEEPSKIEGISDTWSLKEVWQVDFATLRDNDRIEITDMFLGANEPKLTFESTNFTYTVDAGDSQNFLGNGGTWGFDNNQYPTKVILSDATGNRDLNLNRTIRSTDQQLEFFFRAGCDERAGFNYLFIYERASN